MKNNRRDFLKKTGLAGLGIAGSGLLNGLGSAPSSSSTSAADGATTETEGISIIGAYGPWAASLIEGDLPEYSFRRDQWNDLAGWRKEARERYIERLGMPDLGNVPEVTVEKQYSYDGLMIEELSWQLPYGPPTGAIVLKPRGADGPLPGILGFHDHGGNKYFGKRKITRTADNRHPLIENHHQEYYEGMAWANEIAKRGYVVLVSDAFPFASRRVLLSDVPEHLRGGLDDQNPENPENIRDYNDWAGRHEHIMAKSLFSAGTTWPALFLAEDHMALDILCGRDDVDESRVGCGGLSGGGMRTVFMGGMDPRIQCAVCVGFMTTWKDLVVAKSYTHTWMTYVPLLPNELAFPEILGLRVPSATMVLNNEEDALFTLSEMERADDIMGEVYQKAGAADHYQCSFHPGPHKFDRAMQAEAFDWFDRWLKP
ncbi:twin-arginine translocation signal domain-containing protein [Fodinibius sediminis]|uniref:Tat (Twin-arginine translocation) pathway signal sequence n=1 Tax=Fodinibius sediminis TaxID=1214077 RepID=A0A521C024_9BACT|nr:twin-arginine translocation signal domain-containing protein [Fodinibius sediminis]SMO52705.1 Tat (twin-arginine translocation) pathway signal sequence [Fodinibius sediminis]